MRILFAAIVAGTFTASTSHVLAKGEYTDPPLAFAKAQAPDVETWSKVADGLYEGTTAKGDIVRFYTGNAGARIDLAELKRERMRVLGQVEILSAQERSTLPKSVSEQLSRSNKLLEQLDQQIEFMREVASQIDITSKATRTYNADTPIICSYANAGIAQFAANGTPGSWPYAWATMDGWGSAGWVGPPAPIPAVLRQVTAKVTVGETYDSDYTWSYDYSGLIEASAQLNTATGVCELQTMHAAQARCMEGSPWTYYKLFRETTCANVVAGTPPTTHP